MNGREQTEAWSLVAGDVALDFVNTVGGNDSIAHLDAIATYELLLVWSVRAGTLGQEQADGLLRRARRKPSAADQVLGDARALRSSLYDVFHALLFDEPLASAWAKVRPTVADAVARAEPTAEGDVDRVSWSWAGVTELDAPLLPVAHAAAGLLTSPRTDLLRQCGRCRWLFLDQSRNHGRRWCDMRTCGMAQKVERQAERRRES
jgi:predicted RNA-binding Zn ribbon-like protein